MKEMKLEFRRITSADDPIWEFVERVFEDSFPPDERRDYDIQRRLAATEPRFWQCVVFDSGKPVAIISYWILESGNYLEHIATSLEARGGGLGAAIIGHLMTNVATEWFGEVELPTDDLSRRRIGFYERLGFITHPQFGYEQPSYGAGRKPIPMIIMTVGGAWMTEQRLAALVKQMTGLVYPDGEL